MTVRVSKSAFNIREKLSELDKPTGLKGNELMRSDNAQDARNLIGAGRKNMIINGAMQVAQRGTSFTVSDAFTLDRYKFKIAGGGAATITQSSTTPDDFSYSYKVDITTADTSVANTDHGVIMHMVEGYDFAQANFGSSAAKACKLSFYVRSNKTGTYGVAFQNGAQNRSCIQEYTINSADTWERKTITIPADTGGSWATTNGTGLKITWGLMGGSTYATSTLGSYNGSNVFLTSNQVNLFDNTSGEWYMTGVQLEVGSTSTDFEHRSFGEELQLCQRYFETVNLYGSNSNYTSGGYNRQIGQVHWKVEKRAVPTCNGPSVGNYQPGGGSGTVSISGPTIHGGVLNTGSTNSTYPDQWINGGSILTVDAEL